MALNSHQFEGALGVDHLLSLRKSSWSCMPRQSARTSAACPSMLQIVYDCCESYSHSFAAVVIQRYGPLLLSMSNHCWGLVSCLGWCYLPSCQGYWVSRQSSDWHVCPVPFIFWCFLGWILCAKIDPLRPLSFKSLICSKTVDSSAF